MNALAVIKLIGIILAVWFGLDLLGLAVVFIGPLMDRRRGPIPPKTGAKEVKA